jgi:hypothetical protein
MKRTWIIALVLLPAVLVASPVTAEPPAEAEADSGSAIDTLTTAGAAAVYDRLQLTARQKQLFEGTEDAGGRPAEPSFYLMLAKAWQLSKLQTTQADRSQFDTPSYHTLMRRGDRLRFNWRSDTGSFVPLSLPIRIYRITQLSLVNGKISRSPYWPPTAADGRTPDDQPIWEIAAGLARQEHKELQDEQMLVIYSPVLPANLPSPTEGAIDGPDGGTFAMDLRYEMSCLFYRTMADIDKQGRPREYPILIAWDFQTKASPQARGKSGYVLLAIVFGSIMLIIAGFVYVKKRTKKTTRKELFTGYKPLRDEEEEADEDAQIDPELAAAAAAYRKEHHLDDEEGEAGQTEPDANSEPKDSP